MEILTVPSDLTEQLRRFRDITRLSTEKIGQLAGLHSRTVSAVSNAKPGQRFDEDTERRLRDAMTAYLREHVLDVSALYGEIADDSAEIDEVVTKITAKRRRRS